MALDGITLPFLWHSLVGIYSLFPHCFSLKDLRNYMDAYDCPNSSTSMFKMKFGDTLPRSDFGTGGNKQAPGLELG
ncbi:AAB_G0042920.mRNA.1.CDS.1 [Saccharomyces cerevisiae]|nr:AAB_G0042920.mRNA.1.CDS.1 [Saccharomyces cerevisiae]